MKEVRLINGKNRNYYFITDEGIDVLTVEKEMKRFIDYYNNHRYQWDLKKMTPVEYRNHLLIA